MSDFEKSFQKMIDSAISKAIIKYGQKIEKIALDRKKLYSVPELAKYSGFSETTIRNWINRNYVPLPAFQIEKEYRVYLPVFLEWLEQYKVENNIRTKEYAKI